MKELKLHGEKIITGRGSLEYLKTINYKKALIVTSGSSMFNNGTIKKIECYLKEANCDFIIYKGVPKNPDTKVVLDILKTMDSFIPDVVIALGGGSPMDAAKVAALFFEYRNLNFDNVLSTSLPDKREKIKLIHIPSTSGTGAEVTKAAVITFKDKNLKIGLKTLAFIPDIAILDPYITLSMPKNIAGETGMDAMTHLVESYINENLDYYTMCMAEGAIINLLEALPSSCNNGDIESREKVQIFQSIAGSVLSNVGLGMSHGISHCFGGMYDLGHGLLNGICLPYVLKWNIRSESVLKKIDKLSRLIGKDFIKSIEDLNLLIGIPSSLSSILDEELFKKDFNILTLNSLKGSTLANPVKIEEEDMKIILNCIYYGGEFK